MAGAEAAAGVSAAGADACANAETDARANAAAMIEASVFFIVLPLAEKKSNVPVIRDARHSHRSPRPRGRLSPFRRDKT
ncbi:hypothetical protein BO443_120029 [Burkholderia orbicola]